MATGESGFSTPAIANLAAETASPKKPTDLEVLTVGLQSTGSPDELAELVLKFTRPTESELTVTDAATDDIYDSGVKVGEIDDDYNVGIKALDTDVDLTGLLSADDRTTIGTQTTRYIVDSVTAAQLIIKYGLLATASIGDDIKKLTKTAECSSTSRQFRVNAVLADSASIYYDDATLLTKWINTTTLGQWEDLNKILVLINEAQREWTIERLFSGATPVAVTVDGNVSEGETVVPVTADLTGDLTAGGIVTFDSGVNFYILDSLDASDLTLTTGLGEDILDGAQVWFKKLMTDDATPVDYVFEDYDTCLLVNFYGTVVLDDLGGYNLYHKETIATQSIKGTKIEIETDDTNLVNNNDGTSEYTFKAATTYFDGRKLYWSITAYDQRIPTPNESEGDLNAYAVSYPGQAHITTYTEDIDNLTMQITYERITSGGLNPHLDLVMDASVAQYSIRGGYDVFSKEMTELETANGFYEGTDKDNARYVNTGIVLGDIVRVVDTIARTVWLTNATISGEVSLNDLVLDFGTTGLNYLTAHSSTNINGQKMTIDRDNDSVLPLNAATPATPVKQYLTDFNNVYTIEYDSPAKYGTVIESVDTELEKGKL